MCITIWQQYSSNHSASFTVVGRFDSQQQAHIAADQIRNILKIVQTWWQENSSKDWHYKIEAGEITPIEEKLRAEYGVYWPNGINWYTWASWDSENNDPIRTFRQFVIVENPHPDIHYGPQPFDDLLRKLGGTVTIEVEESRSYPDTYLCGDLIFTAPNVAIADTIEDLWHQYLDAPEEAEVLAPWMVYYSGKRDPYADTLAIAGQIYLSDFWGSQKNGRLYHAILIAEMRGEKEHFENLMRQYEQLYKEGAIHLTIDEYKWVEQAVDVTWLSKDWHYDRSLTIKVDRDRLKFRISNLIFPQYMAVQMRAITAWLEDQGCTEVDFTFTNISLPPITRRNN